MSDEALHLDDSLAKHGTFNLSEDEQMGRARKSGLTPNETRKIYEEGDNNSSQKWYTLFDLNSGLYQKFMLDFI